VSDYPLLDRILELWRKRGIVADAAAIERLKRAMTEQAFFLTGEWEEKMLDKIKGLLDKALEEGWTSKEFKDAAAAILDRFNDGSYAEIVFRTNVSTANTAGKVSERWDAEWAEFAPYWKFVAKIDAKNDADDECPDTRCRWLNGRIFAKDDAAASRFIPILHFGCRCDTRDQTRDDVEGKTITKGSEIPFEPLPGWDGSRFFSLAKFFSGGL